MEDLVEKLVAITKSEEEREALKERLAKKGIYLELGIIACVPTIAAPLDPHWRPAPEYSVYLRGYQFNSGVFVMKALRDFALKHDKCNLQYANFIYPADLKNIKDIVHRSEKETICLFKTEIKKDAVYLEKLLQESGADVVVKEDVQSL